MVTKEMVAGMKAGSITVDLAAEAGGNIETTVKDEKFVTPNGGKYSTHSERNTEQRVCTVLLLMEIPFDFQSFASATPICHQGFQRRRLRCIRTIFRSFC